MAANISTPQPASTRWFSFGVAFAIFGEISIFNAALNPAMDKHPSNNELVEFALFWAAFGTVWWLIRRRKRAKKQARYEAYIIASEQQIAQEKHRKQLAQERADTERERQRNLPFEVQLDRIQQLHFEGILDEYQVSEFKEKAAAPGASALLLELGINEAENFARKELRRNERIRSQYDSETADKLIARRIETGMTREQLISSFGHTSTTERTITKDGEQETLIYGSKVSGSYFHLVDGIVTKAVVRNSGKPRQ